MTRPAKSDVYVMDVAPMAASAEELDAIITTALECSHNVHQTIHRFDWDGAAHDAALIRADRQVEEDHAMLSALGDLRDAEREGAATMGPMISRLRTDGQALEADGFTVAEDWTVTDAWDYDAMFPVARVFGPDMVAALTAKQAARADDAKTATARLQPLADELGEADRKTQAGIVKATNALNLSIGRAPTAPGDGKKNGPTIQLVDNETPAPGDQPAPPRITSVTPVTDPLAPEALPDGQTAMTDLNDTTPGWGHTVTGDGHGSPPLVDGKPTSIKPGDNRRALPTGVGRDANGNVIVGIATPKYGTDTSPDAFITKDTEIWNFADPQHPVKVGTLVDKSQASVYYNSAEKQWVVVGDDMAQPGGPRHIWTAPADPSSPNAWMNNLTDRGAVPDGGNRENQYIPLKGGGAMLLDTSNGGGVRASVAGSTEGLTQSGVSATPIAGQIVPAAAPPLPSGAPAQATWDYGVAYGPTVVGDVVNGNTETVTVRLSTWDKLAVPPGVVLPPDMDGSNNYFPHTYTYSVTVER